MGLQKNEYFWEYEESVGICLCHQKTVLFLGVISLHFNSFFFLKLMVQCGEYFWGSH